MALCISNLEKCFNTAKEEGFKFVGIKVWMYGFDKEEIIINPTENFEKKLEYYKSAYNEDLTLKSVPGKIRIIGFTYGDSFNQIEKDLLGKSNKQSITIDAKMNIDEKEIEKIAKERLIGVLQKNIKCQMI